MSAALVADCPCGVCTRTSTLAGGCGGVVAVSCVDETPVKPAAAREPKATWLVPVKLKPLIVTFVPPPAGPAVGESEPTIGAKVVVYRSAELTADVPPGVVTRTSTVAEGSA